MRIQRGLEWHHEAIERQISERLLTIYFISSKLRANEEGSEIP